jgi:hypothetical protein
MIRGLALEILFGLMAGNTKANGKMESNMEMASKLQLVVKSVEAYGRMEK